VNFRNIAEAAVKTSFQGKASMKQIDTSKLDATIKRVVKRGNVDSKDVAEVSEFVKTHEKDLSPLQKKALEEVMTSLRETPLDIAYLQHQWRKV
jgi:hypothetical protein